MIDVALTKENALPSDLWGLLSERWGPDPEKGVTVFLQGLELRGPDNRRKRIYMSAVTPDLYDRMYKGKVVRFWDELLSQQNIEKPLMRIYLDTFWDLYWDLHLGVRGTEIPDQVREIGASFNAVLAYRDPTQKIVYDNYMAVRERLAFLKSWIDDRLADIGSGKTPEPEKTFAWYWLKNGEDSEYFNHQDVVFECFHNFVAFSQWGNSLYNVMSNLGREGGDPQAKDWFTKTMAGDFDKPDGSAFPPLERLRHGVVPHDLAQRRQHLGARADATAGVREPRVYHHTPPVDEQGSGPVVEPRRFRSGPLSVGANEPADRRSANSPDGSGQLPVHADRLSGQGRAQGGVA